MFFGGELLDLGLTPVDLVTTSVLQFSMGTHLKDVVECLVALTVFLTSQHWAAAEYIACLFTQKRVAMSNEMFAVRLLDTVCKVILTVSIEHQTLEQRLVFVRKHR